MGNRIVPFGIAVGAIALVAGIVGLGIYRQSVPALNGNSTQTVQSQGDQDVSDVGTVVSGSNLEPLSAEKVVVPLVCPDLRADGTTASCYDFVQKYTISNPFVSFNGYAEYTKRTLIPELIRANYSSLLDGQELEKKVEEELVMHSGDYEFWEEEVDGHPALLHRRNFYGAIGNVYEMHIGIGDGKIVVLSSEIDNDILNAIYHSYAIPESAKNWRTYENTYKSVGTFSFRYPSRVCDFDWRCYSLTVTESNSVISLNELPDKGHLDIFYGSGIADEKSANKFLQAALKNNLCKIDPSNTYVLEGTTIKNVFFDSECFFPTDSKASGFSGKVRAYWAMGSKELIVYQLGQGGGCAFTDCGVETEISNSMELSGVNLSEQLEMY